MIKKLDEPLLVAEDSDADFTALQRFMSKMEVQNPIYRCINGDEVLEFLYQEGEYKNPDTAPRPSVILLDLNLPGTDGRLLLEQLKQDDSFKAIPIIIFTTSSNPKDIEFCYQKGANGYLVKPIDTNRLQKIVETFVEYWLRANTSPVFLDGINFFS